MPIIRRLHLVTLLMPSGLVACGDDPVAPGPGEVPAVISPARQWSAGTVTIEWPWLEGKDELPAFVAGGSLVPVQRTGESTVLLRLPHTHAGPISIVAYPDNPFGDDFASPGIVLGTVEVAGFTGIVTAPALLPWPLPWPTPGATAVIGRNPAGSVVRFDLESGLLETLPISLPAGGGYPFVGSGSGSGLGRVLLSDPVDDTLQVWDLSAAPSLVEKIPVLPHDGVLQAHLLTPDRLLMADDDNIWVYSHDAGTGNWVQTQFDRTGPDEVVVSPTSDRVAVMMVWSDDYNGVPYVLEGDGSSPAFFLPTLSELFSGAFSPDGASLVLAARAGTAPTQRLVRVSAASGEVEAEVLLESPGGVTGGLGRVVYQSAVEQSAVAATPGRVLVAFNDWTDPAETALRVRLLVLRAEDLGFVAELRAPPSAGSLVGDPYLAISPDGTEALLYDNESGKLLRFALLPE